MDPQGGARRHGLLAEMTAAVLPLVVLILDHGGEQAHQRCGAGQDAYHLGAAVEFGVSTFVDEIDRQWSIGESR